ncbi:MAG: hypothetical protein ACLQU2_04725 [Candidatus Binataceae bacterium]
MSNLSDIEREAQQARDNLSRTLNEVNRKAAVTGSELRLPEHHIRRFPLLSLCGAMALGFAAGGSSAPAMVLGVIALGGTLMGPKVIRSDCQDGFSDGTD